ncbi:MAG: hypothetical protein ACRDBG_02945 [Waterburya sp.]
MHNYEKQQFIDRVLQTIQEIEQGTSESDVKFTQSALTRLAQEIKKVPEIEQAIDHLYNRGITVKELSTYFGKIPKRSTVKLKSKIRRYPRMLLTSEFSGELFAVLILP